MRILKSLLISVKSYYKIMENLELILKNKINTIFSEICKIDDRPIIKLKVSSLRTVMCSINSYITKYFGDYRLSYYICCDESWWALRDISASKCFDSELELAEYIKSNKFESDVKNSKVWKYCSDESFRESVIKDHEAKAIQSFKSLYKEIIKNVEKDKISELIP